MSIEIIGGGKHSAALMLLVSEAMTGVEVLPAGNTAPGPKFTHADAERLAKAEAKRARKAAKRLKDVHVATKLRVLGDGDCLMDADEAAWRQVMDARGGCSCHISPPCSACSEPLTEGELNDVGYTYGGKA